MKVTASIEVLVNKPDRYSGHDTIRNDTLHSVSISENLRLSLGHPELGLKTSMALFDDGWEFLI